MSTGGGKQPKETTQTISNIPKFAEPYAMQMLGQSSALTNINQNPYQSYGGDRFAGFTPLQEQSFDAAGSMNPSGQIGMGTGLALAGGIGSLNPGQFGQAEADQYMSPYMNNVIDQQQREAIRSDGIAGTMRGARAVASGAFDGNRSALVEAEAGRNLGQRLDQIEATGLQSSYQQAQQQFNADQSRRMQGYGQALQGANALGALGESEYGQNMGITNLQNQYGGQQQGLEQAGLEAQYQEFLNRQNFPYQQLGFQSDLIRGLPTDSSSTIYGQSNTTAQNVGLAGGLGSLYMGSRTGG